MRFLVRLLGVIWLATLVVSAGFAYLEVREERERQIDALKRRATLVGAAVAEASERLVTRGARAGYERVLARFSTADRGLAIYDGFGGMLGATADVRPFLGPLSPLVTDAIRRNEPVAGFHNVAGRLTWVHVVPVQQDDRAVGAAAVLLDAQYLEAGEWDLWRRTAVRMGVLMLFVTGITWALVRWSVTRPIERIAEWTKQMKAGRSVPPPPDADESLFGPLATEVTGLARRLARARSAAEQEARLRLAGESVWTEERLKQFVELRFGGRPVFVVSNREPVSHVRDGRVVREQEPASGLVTALGPIMQACGGVWVAHGSGNADREVGERIGLPSSDPTRSFTATTSSRPWSAPSRVASSGISSPSSAASTRRTCGRFRSASLPTSASASARSTARPRWPRSVSPRSSSASGWSESTTPRACPSGSARYAASSNAGRSTGGDSRSSRSRHRAAAASRAIRRCRKKPERWCARSTPTWASVAGSRSCTASVITTTGKSTSFTGWRISAW